MEEGVIRIHRKTGYFGMARRLIVKIDRKRAGHVTHNGSSEFRVQEGWHEVEVSMDWTGSPEFTIFVGAGSVVCLTCILNGGFWRALTSSLFSPGYTYVLVPDDPGQILQAPPVARAGMPRL